jgi:hypothetical protein
MRDAGPARSGDGRWGIAALPAKLPPPLGLAMRRSGLKSSKLETRGQWPPSGDWAVACRAKTQSVARLLDSAAWACKRFNAPPRFAQDGHPPGLWERPATRACQSRPQ